MFSIKPNGNVGIGTVNPTQKLEVAGNIKLTSNSIAYVDLYGAGDEYNYSELSFNNTGDKHWTIAHKKYQTQLDYFALEYVDGSNWYQMFAVKPNGNFGIGTQEPKSKLQVTNGDVYIENIGSGVIMKSPNGNSWRITIDDSGNLVRTAITCP